MSGRCPQFSILETPPRTTFCCRFCLCLIIVLACAFPICVIKYSDICLNTIIGSEDAPIDFGHFSTVEGMDPEDKDIFYGFKTSFLPPEEVGALRFRRSVDGHGNVIDGNLTADQFLWGDVDKNNGYNYLHSYRSKRMAYYPLSSSQRSTDPYSKSDQIKYFSKSQSLDSADVFYGDNVDETSTEKYKVINEDLEGMIPPENHVDRGPFDDLVEQVRRQPELEEGEMGSAAHLYKHTKSYTMIHSFWKGQGDQTTIRKTQANIMRQYMDGEADPCVDFYQYACGNWAPLNPIPADKAGYDTFEMLRENLDSVLKDLLEFKKDEKVPETYPGPHLDLKENFLSKAKKKPKASFMDLDFDDFGNDDETYKLGFNKLTIEKNNKSEILERIRRYLDKKSKTLFWPFHIKIKKVFRNHKHKRNKHKHNEDIKFYRKRSATTPEYKTYKDKLSLPEIQSEISKSSITNKKQRLKESKTLSIVPSAYNTIKLQKVLVDNNKLLKVPVDGKHHKQPQDDENNIIVNLNQNNGPKQQSFNSPNKIIVNLDEIHNTKLQSITNKQLNNVSPKTNNRVKRQTENSYKMIPTVTDESHSLKKQHKHTTQTQSVQDLVDDFWDFSSTTLKTDTDSESVDLANGDAALKSRFLFKSCMNYAILEKRGHQPLLDLLDLLGGWPMLNPEWDDQEFDWLELMAKLRLFNNDILISEWVGPDIKNSDEFVIQFDQTSLGLPTRDYFLQKSNEQYLEAYKQYLITVGILLGGNETHVRKSADELIEFEIKLAKITSAPEDRRNVSELYRRMPLHKLEVLVPEVKWRRYLCVVMNRTVKSDEIIVLFALSYVRHLVELIHDTPTNTLSNYLLWRFVRHRVNNLDDRFQFAKQQFYYVLFGREEAPPRWKNCISQVNSNMGMALGSMFVRKYFDETSKNDTLTMTREIQQSFRELLHLTNWIDDATKKLAAHKVDAMMLRIGYPDFILNKQELNDRYKEVKIHPDKYFENILNILQHLTKMEQGRLGQPVNKTLWNTAPAVVNAYYSRNKNQIMFPAGILQPPFYHRHFPRSLNYGGIGVVIGHEITHGFDDKGRLFDCDGNLHRWWSDSAIESFHRRAQCLIDQYGRYVVPEVNMKLDGVNTQGENIADNGGVKQAFRAYLRWLEKNGPEGETLPGLNHTHKQLFFLNFAQVWCGAMRPEAMRNKLKTAVHSPGRFRVIGTLSNSHDFAREFKCPPGSPMNPTSKCTVW